MPYPEDDEKTPIFSEQPKHEMELVNDAEQVNPLYKTEQHALGISVSHNSPEEYKHLSPRIDAKE